MPLIILLNQVSDEGIISMLSISLIKSALSIQVNEEQTAMRISVQVRDKSRVSDVEMIDSETDGHHMFDLFRSNRQGILGLESKLTDPRIFLHYSQGQ